MDTAGRIEKFKTRYAATPRDARGRRQEGRGDGAPRRRRPRPPRRTAPRSAPRPARRSRRPRRRRPRRRPPRRRASSSAPPRSDEAASPRGAASLRFAGATVRTRRLEGAPRDGLHGRRMRQGLVEYAVVSGGAPGARRRGASRSTATSCAPRSACARRRRRRRLRPHSAATPPRARRPRLDPRVADRAPVSRASPPRPRPPLYPPAVTPLVLIVDDEKPEPRVARQDLRARGVARGARRVRRRRRSTSLRARARSAVVVTDLMMPGMSGDELLRAVKALSPETEVVLMTAYGTVETAVAAMKEGAYDFITKPVKRARHREVGAAGAREGLARGGEPRAARAAGRARAGRARRAASATPPRSAPCSTRSARRRRPRRPCSSPARAAPARSSRARLVHDLSPRAAGPFVADQLRGHPGEPARVGAVRPREGRLHRRGRAQGGPLRARPRRHAVPRRGGRDVARRAGEAAALPAGRRARARRRHRAASASTCASSPRPTGPRRRGRGPGASARTSSTGSTSSRCACRRCASGARTCCSSRAPSCAGFAEANAQGGHRLHAAAAAAALERYGWPGNVRELQHAVERAVILTPRRGGGRRGTARGGPRGGGPAPAARGRRRRRAHRAARDADGGDRADRHPADARADARRQEPRRADPRDRRADDLPEARPRRGGAAASSPPRAGSRTRDR